MNEYPTSDKAIRMWCLEYVSSGFCNGYTENHIKDAQLVYDFVCPHHKEEQPERRRKSLAQKFRSFLSELKG